MFLTIVFPDSKNINIMENIFDEIKKEAEKRLSGINSCHE